jgi:hypothetical protein
MKYILALALAVSLYACDCGEKDCRGVPPEHNQWLPYELGEKVSFINGNGQQIDFNISQYNLGLPSIIDCGQSRGSGCRCAECPDPISSTSGTTTDLSRSIVTTTGQTVRTFNAISTAITLRDSSDTAYVSYTVFDHSNKFAIAPGVTLNTRDSLLPSYTVGNVTYPNVIVHEVDTLATPYGNPIYNVYFVWKSWYNKDHGVIAFYDLKTRSLFYRKP